ncbi:HU family DNA-binding protein [Candidatus Riflebacteria bacterium]
MNKTELVSEVAKKVRISQTQAKEVLEATLDTIKGALSKGKSVQFVGFGTFKVSHRKARTGINPQTGASIKIAAKNVAQFSPGSDLKSAVESGKKPLKKKKK